MIKIIQTLLITLLSFTVFSQEAKLITHKFNHSKQTAERYTVLKSNKQIRHGTYISYFRIPENEYKEMKKDVLKLEAYVKQKGNYLNGKKDGEWVEYATPKILGSKGNYKEGQKTGVWETYKEQGQVINRYDHDSNKKLKPFIKANIVYPKRARKAGIQGTVMLKYRINSDCSIDNITVEKSVNPDCDKAAIDTIKKLGALSKKYDWECAQAELTQEITFKLD